MASEKSYSSTNPLVKYVAEHSMRLTDAQKRLMEETLQQPWSGMMGAPEVVQMNGNLMQAIGAKRVLDVGVFTGFSSLGAALALPPEGQVHALDVSEEYTSLGKKYWKEAKVSHKIHLHLAPAAETLQKFIDDGQAGTFDFAFIDADKVNYDRYYEQCLVLLRRGGIIAIDNTIWGGKVICEEDQSPDTVAIRNLNEKLKDDPRINISFLNIGDGLTFCFIK